MMHGRKKTLKKYIYVTLHDEVSAVLLLPATLIGHASTTATLIGHKSTFVKHSIFLYC